MPAWGLYHSLQRNEGDWHSFIYTLKTKANKDHEIPFRLIYRRYRIQL